jgi:hypothetical protein
MKSVIDLCAISAARRNIASCCGVARKPRRAERVETKHPARGPYCLGETHIAALMAQPGLAATVYKEVSRVADIPDVALILVDYNDDMEVRRHILFHREKASHSSGTVIEYALDPASWCKPADRVRTNFRSIAGHWVIGLHAMSGRAGSGK